jgi:hypothetical protein
MIERKASTTTLNTVKEHVAFKGLSSVSKELELVNELINMLDLKWHDTIIRIEAQIEQLNEQIEELISS